MSGVPRNHTLICYTMAVREDHLWIGKTIDTSNFCYLSICHAGTNMDKVVVIKIENSNKWSMAQEVCVGSGKQENQIKCVTISNCGLVSFWLSSKVNAVISLAFFRSGVVLKVQVT